MLPVVTFVEGGSSPSSTLYGKKSISKPPRNCKKTSVKKNVPAEKKEPIITRSRLRKLVADEKEGSEPLPSLSTKGKEECHPVHLAFLPPWVEKNYEIPTTLGPYSLSRYSRNHSVHLLENPRLAIESRLMALRTCARCPTSEYGSRCLSNGAIPSSTSHTRPKPVASTTDTSPPPSPPNLFPSYSVTPCQKHPARRKTQNRDSG